MSEEMNVQQPEEVKTYADSLTFDESVIEKIAGLAAREIGGILDMKGNFISGLTESFSSGTNPTKGVSAEVDEQNVSLDIRIILEYGASAPSIFEQLKSHIREQLGTMTGLNLRELNVRVVDVMTRKEWEKGSEPAQPYAPNVPGAPGARPY